MCITTGHGIWKLQFMMPFIENRLTCLVVWETAGQTLPPNFPWPAKNPPKKLLEDLPSEVVHTASTTSYDLYWVLSAFTDMTRLGCAKHRKQPSRYFVPPLRLLPPPPAPPPPPPLLLFLSLLLCFGSSPSHSFPSSFLPRSLMEHIDASWFWLSWSSVVPSSTSDLEEKGFVFPEPHMYMPGRRMPLEPDSPTGQVISCKQADSQS